MSSIKAELCNQPRRAPRTFGSGGASRLFQTAGLIVFALTSIFALTSCGYHTSGHAVRLPTDVHTVYVPMFGSTVQEFRVEQVITAAVVQELHSRTNFHVTTSPKEAADATLKGVITYAVAIPQTYDSQTGKVSEYLLIMSARASLVRSDGKTLWDNPNYTYRDQYQISQDPTSFFEEATPAVQRAARDFSRDLVSNILEAY